MQNSAKEEKAIRPLLDVQKLASALGVPRSWVYSRTRIGGLPTIRVGKYVRFRLDDVLAHLDQESADGE